MNKNTPAWAVLLICWLALLCDGYDLYVYGATLPGFLADPSWDVTKASAGVVGSIALVGMLIGSLSAGTLTDRLGRRRLMLASLATFTVGMLLCAAAPSFEFFALFRFITCLGVGGLLPTAVAIASESAPSDKRSIAVGAVLLGPPVGSLVGALTAGALVAEYGVRPVYAIGATSVVVFAVVLVFLPEPTAFKAAGVSIAHQVDDENGTAHMGNKVRQLFTEGHLTATLLSWASCLISLLVITGITTWLPVIMQDAGFATGSSIGFLSIYSVGCIVGTVVLAFGAQRWAPKYMVIFGFGAAAVALAGVSLTQNHGLLTLAVFIAGIGGMATQNMINDHVAQYYPSEIRATGLGWTLGIGRIGMIIGPVYGGYAATIGGTPAAAAMWFAIPACLGIVVAICLPRKKQPSAIPSIALTAGME
jgi:AAHS family benzoate transporter-like MFS transporter